MANSSTAVQPTVGSREGVDTANRNIPALQSAARPIVAQRYHRAFAWDDDDAEYLDLGRGPAEDKAVFQNREIGPILLSSRREAIEIFARIADRAELVDLLYRWNRYRANEEGMTRAQFGQIEIDLWAIGIERSRIARHLPKERSQVQYAHPYQEQNGAWAIEAQTTGNGWVGVVRWALNHDRTIMEIIELRTDEEWAGLGIGRTLMKMAAAQAQLLGVLRIKLEANAQRRGHFLALEEAQDTLVGFYGSLGYVAEGRSRWMSKDVG